MELEQQQLNQLTDEAFLALRRLPSSRLGFVPAHPNPFSLVTYTFVHGGWLHLLGNMLFLFLTAPFIEDLYGRPLFAVLYFVSGVAGAGAFAAGAPHTEIALVGASGAIAGVMAAFLVRLAARRIEFLVLPVPIIPTFRFHLKLPAFVVIPLWAAEQLYYASSVAEADSSVAFSAHVGGFAAGLVFAGAVKLLGIEERFINPAIEREIGVEQNPDITRAADARVAGDFATARRLIDAVLRKEPANVDAWTQSFEVALDAADAERAGQAGHQAARAPWPRRRPGHGLERRERPALARAEDAQPLPVDGRRSARACRRRARSDRDLQAPGPGRRRRATSRGCGRS